MKKLVKCSAIIWIVLCLFSLASCDVLDMQAESLRMLDLDQPYEQDGENKIYIFNVGDAMPKLSFEVVFKGDAKVRTLHIYYKSPTDAYPVINQYLSCPTLFDSSEVGQKSMTIKSGSCEVVFYYKIV